MIDIIENYIFKQIEENLDTFTKSLIQHPKQRGKSNADFIQNVVINVIV